MVTSGAKTVTFAANSESLWIRTSAGPQTGFGHLRRCLVLARALQDCCTPVFLLDGRDDWSREQVEGQGWNLSCRELDEIWAAIPPPSVILIDTRVTAGLRGLIARARDRRIPVISIHDLGLSPLPSDIVIDGSIAPSRADIAWADAVFYSGPGYMVLDPAFGRLHGRRKKISEKIQSIFINLGGGESERFFLKVLEGLKLWSGHLEVIAVPGFVPGMPERLSRRCWAPLQVHWEDHDIERFLFRADLAITAGGVAAYEALCSGTPLLSLSYDSLQNQTNNALAGRGACINLGLGENLDSSRLCEALSLLDSDIELRKSLSNAGRQVVDGQGAERVARIIRQSIQISLLAEQGRSPGVAGAGF